ncbi:MAG: hypothetical protein IPP55_17960 [Anaerolineales bacterium]|nr:hypothetical protein [Anaerolineales bacterium]
MNRTEITISIEISGIAMYRVQIMVFHNIFEIIKHNNYEKENDMQSVQIINAHPRTSDNRKFSFYSFNKMLFPLIISGFFIKITQAPNGLRYLRWGGDGEAVRLGK